MWLFKPFIWLYKGFFWLVALPVMLYSLWQVWQ